MDEPVSSYLLAMPVKSTSSASSAFGGTEDFHNCNRSAAVGVKNGTMALKRRMNALSILLLKFEASMINPGKSSTRCSKYDTSWLAYLSCALDTFDRLPNNASASSKNNIQSLCSALLNTFSR